MNLVKLILIVLLLAVGESTKQCPPGNYIATSGDCRPCPMGSFQPRANKYGCKPCPPNTIASNEGSTECTTCTNGAEPSVFRHECVCKDGSIEENGICIKCKPGTFFDKGHDYRGDYRICEECQPGYFQPDAGQLTCLECPNGSTSGYAAKECVTCKEDEHLDLYTHKCEKCKAGFSFQTFRCIECPENTYKPKPGPGPCLVCPPRTYSRLGSKNCTPCPKGTVLFKNGKCRSCPPGTHFEYFFWRCEKCGFNQFMPHRNVREFCFECSGKTFALRGATKCVRCPKHQFLQRDGTCKPCPIGAVFLRYKLKCQNCRVNEYNRAGRYCRGCPEGSYALPGATKCFTCEKDEALILKKKKCATCPPGRFYEQYKAKCTKCREGYIKRKAGLGVCVKCPIGTTSNGQRTECAPED